jgi:hypothetical protein
VLFSAATLLQRLSWILPLPKIHLARSHGVLASAHPLRPFVVPSPPEWNFVPLRETALPATCTKKSRWIDWGDLLKRVFALDVLACVCGARRRVMAVIKDERVARKILEHLGLPAQAPEMGRVPDPAQSELWPSGLPFDETCQAPAPDEFDQRLAECESQE